MFGSRLFATAGLMALLLPFAASSEPGRRPVPVSPGALERVVAVVGRCPTFSWADTREAEGFELAVYRIGGEDEAARGNAREVDRVARATTPGGTRSWTPASEGCLASGGRYAWLVREIAAEGSSEWSEPMLFEIEDPSETDVREAVAVLRSYLARVEPSWESGDAAVDVERGNHRSGGAGPGPSVGASRAVPAAITGTAAIHAELPDTTGAAHGLVGVSNSADGAGLAAENSAGGADLLIQGDGASPSALITEATLDRAAGGDQTFDFVNTGGGAMTLRVEGVDVVTTATDADTLAALGCASDEIAKWSGSAWQCAVDEVGQDTLASLSCASDEIVRWNGATWQCSSDLDALGALSCSDTQVAQWNGAAWICANVGTDTLASLSCATGQVVHWNGAAWTCGQPTFTHLTCSASTGGGSTSCTMNCPSGSVVWSGGCNANTSDIITDSNPIDSAGVPTGWRCEVWDPLGGSAVNGSLYCVVQ